jgi:hypothetical protein
VRWNDEHAIQTKWSIFAHIGIRSAMPIVTM